MRKEVWIFGGILFAYLLFRSTVAQARGVRNNNPGNIRNSPGTVWNGQVGIDDKGFVVFDTKLSGLRAATITAYHYFTQDGIKTISQFAARWAPASDGNNVNEYVSKLAAQLKVNPSLVFDYRNRLADLVNAITHNEGNQNLNYTQAEFQAASKTAQTL